jgi:hypothetical protein
VDKRLLRRGQVDADSIRAFVALRDHFLALDLLVQAVDQPGADLGGESGRIFIDPVSDLLPLQPDAVGVETVAALACKALVVVHVTHPRFR